MRHWRQVLPIGLMLIAAITSGQQLPNVENSHRAALSRLNQDAYAEHVAKLREQLNGKSFHIFVEHPFVVVGDESAPKVAARTESTIRWAVQHLKKTYFANDPDHMITIWLFKDKESYDTHCEELFSMKPTTPFGFYSSTKRALIMNISTGGGTLVHEIVHPFIAANFPDCPAWFNEGLASLYEQCGEENGVMVGYTNWRLRGLQLAIEKGSVPSFQKMMQTSHREFYDDDPGTNYAQARYLCYYLQEQGKLVDFYRAFVKNASVDVTGEATLKQILGINSWVEFQQDWESYVSQLKF
jgi:hypothetical protein